MYYEDCCTLICALRAHIESAKLPTRQSPPPPEIFQRVCFALLSLCCASETNKFAVVGGAEKDILCASGRRCALMMHTRHSRAQFKRSLAVMVYNMNGNNHQQVRYYGTALLQQQQHAIMTLCSRL